VCVSSIIVSRSAYSTAAFYSTPTSRIYVYIYLCVCVCEYIYIYIYIIHFVVSPCLQHGRILLDADQSVRPELLRYHHKYRFWVHPAQTHAGHVGAAGGKAARRGRRCSTPGEYISDWPLHDIVITNIVWCIAYKREVGGGVVYCPIVVQ